MYLKNIGISMMISISNFLENVIVTATRIYKEIKKRKVEPKGATFRDIVDG